MLFMVYKKLLPLPIHYRHCNNNIDTNSIPILKSKKSNSYNEDTNCHPSASPASYQDYDEQLIKETDPLTYRSGHIRYDLPGISRTNSGDNWFLSDNIAVPVNTVSQNPKYSLSSSSSKEHKKGNYRSSSKKWSQESELYPEEKLKTAIAAVLAYLGFAITATSIVLTHERVPDRGTYGPLPDIVLDNIQTFDWALDFSEYIIIVSINSVSILLLFHRHRFIVFRRLFLIIALLYLYRAVTMYITVLPISSRTYHCDRKMTYITYTELFKRILKLMSGLGLSINGKHVYCGDFIYSGHTVTLVLSYLIISEYTSEKFWFLHWIYWLLAILGIVLLQCSHGHYTIDILIAYYVTTRVFWIYHTLANNKELKEGTTRNCFSRVWWFQIFQYFERNVGDCVPNDYDWPFWCRNKRADNEE